MKKNITWVTLLKSIGILTVILGHIASPLTTFIFSWHMPLFFFLSGLFLNIQLPFKEFLKKDFRRLMIPYFIFAPFGIFVELIKRMLLKREQISLPIELKGVFFDMNYAGLEHHYGFVLWFLPTLFLGRIFIFSVAHITRGKLFFMLLIMTTCFTLSLYLNLPFAIDHAMNALPWIWLGFFVSPHKEKLIPLWAGMIAFLGSIGIYFYASGFPMVNMAAKYYSNIPLNFLWSICLTASFVFLIMRIKVPPTKTLASETMLLFVFHPYTNNIAHLVCDKINLPLWWLKFLFSLLLLYLIFLFKGRFKERGIFKYV